MPYDRPYPGGWKNKPDFSTSMNAAALDTMDDGIDQATTLAEAAQEAADAATLGLAGKAPLLEVINSVPASGGGTVAIPNPVSTLKTYNRVVLTGNCTITLPTVSEPGVISITLLLIQDATGGRTPTLPGSITWIGGPAPTIASGANAATEVVLWTEGSSSGWFGVGQSTAVGGSGPMPVATMSSAGTAHGGTIYELDTTSGTFLVTVEAAAAATGDVVLKWVKGTVPPTVAFTSGDHWNLSTNGNVPTFIRINQAYRLSPNGGSIWVGTGLDFPPSGLVLAPSAGDPTGSVPTKQSDGSIVYQVPSGSGTPPGSIIGLNEYSQNTAQTDATITGSTLADLATAATAAGWAGAAAGMFDVTFTVPASGNVIVDLAAFLKSSASGGGTKVGIWDVGAGAVLAGTMQIQSGTNQQRLTYKRKFTGLTPGASLTWRIQWSSIGANTSTISAGGTNGTVWFSVLAAA